MRFDHARPAVDDPALRYSLAEFRELIFAAFAAAGVRTMVEIGAEGGAFTEQLIRWAEDHDGRLISVDPAPSDLVRRLDRESDVTTLIEHTSVDVLPTLEACDAYLIDGDHNYFTVSSELALISAAATAAATHPLLVVDDVGWPSGRRDQYYRPDDIPERDRRPYDYGGIVPWSATSGRRGFRGDGHFAFAAKEGGEHNGVLCALEDFMAESSGWEAMSLPCIFGLAFVYPEAAPWADGIRRVVGPFADHPLLARLESNRLVLYLRLIDAQDEHARGRRLEADRIARLESELDDVRAELAVAEQALRQAESTRDAAMAAASAATGTAPAPEPSLRRVISAVRGR